MIIIEDLIVYCCYYEIFVMREVEIILFIDFGIFYVIGYFNLLDMKEYIVFVKGDILIGELVFVCVYFECLIGDVFGLYCCDCGL